MPATVGCACFWPLVVSLLSFLEQPTLLVFSHLKTYTQHWCIMEIWDWLCCPTKELWVTALTTFCFIPAEQRFAHLRLSLGKVLKAAVKLCLTRPVLTVIYAHVERQLKLGLPRTSSQIHTDQTPFHYNSFSLSLTHTWTHTRMVAHTVLFTLWYACMDKCTVDINVLCCWYIMGLNKLSPCILLKLISAPKPEYIYWFLGLWMEQLSQSVSAGAANDTVFLVRFILNAPAASFQLFSPPTFLLIWNSIMSSVRLLMAWGNCFKVLTCSWGQRCTQTRCGSILSCLSASFWQCCYSSEKGKSGLVKCIMNKAVTHSDAVSLLQVIPIVAEEYCKWFTEPKAFPLSASSTLLIGSSGQASVTNRNACERTLLIGISRSGGVLSDENCWFLPDASSMTLYKTPRRAY